jgi:hypothetical protein
VGCQLVNDVAWERIRASHGEHFSYLGIGKNVAHQQFTHEFEICKKNFPWSNAGYHIEFKPSFVKQQEGVPPKEIRFLQYVQKSVERIR